MKTDRRSFLRHAMAGSFAATVTLAPVVGLAASAGGDANGRRHDTSCGDRAFADLHHCARPDRLAVQCGRRLDFGNGPHHRQFVLSTPCASGTNGAWVEKSANGDCGCPLSDLAFHPQPSFLDRGFVAGVHRSAGFQHADVFNGTLARETVRTRSRRRGAGGGGEQAIMQPGPEQKIDTARRDGLSHV